MPSHSAKAKPGFSRAAPTAAKARPPRSRWTIRLAVLSVLAVAAAGVAGALVFLKNEDQGRDAVAWSRLNTADVHSLAFDPTDSAHLYFGHHGGLLESRDDGRSWQPTALSNADAMNVRVSDGGLIQIAGHEVYVETRDGGQTWEPVPNDLLGLDLHSFVVEPTDPTHAWVSAVGYGLFETTDAGRHWELRLAENVGPLTIYEDEGQPVLVGLTQIGIGRSRDGGLTWQPLTRPGGQLASLAASPDGSILYAGTTEGLQRSTDGGQTWVVTAMANIALTIAISNDGDVAIVDDATRFYRSSDGAATWPGPV